MDEVEARVRCLELAATVSQRVGDHSVQGIVDFATVLYSFAKASPPAEMQAKPSDKPKRGKPVRQADILS